MLQLQFLDFRLVTPFRNQSASEATGVENRGGKLRTFYYSVKIKIRVDFFLRNRGPNHLYFCRYAAEPCQRSLVGKKDRDKTLSSEGLIY